MNDFMTCYCRVLLAGVLFLATACHTRTKEVVINSSSTQTAVQPATPDNRNGIDPVAQTPICDQSAPIAEDTVVNEAFVSSVLKTGISCRAVRTAFADGLRQRIIQANENDPAIKDTIETYRIGCDTAAFISSELTCIVLYASLGTDHLPISKGKIRIGMDRATLAAALHLKRTPPGSLLVTDAEGYHELLFTFEGDRLHRIIYTDQYVE